MSKSTFSLLVRALYLDIQVLQLWQILLHFNTASSSLLCIFSKNDSILLYCLNPLVFFCIYVYFIYSFFLLYFWKFLLNSIFWLMDQQNFSVKSQIVNNFFFTSHMISVTTMQSTVVVQRQPQTSQGKDNFSISLILYIYKMTFTKLTEIITLWCIYVSQLQMLYILNW